MEQEGSNKFENTTASLSDNSIIVIYCRVHFCFSNLAYGRGVGFKYCKYLKSSASSA